MDDEPEVIRQQMAETRSSLTDKIERLEQTVTDKVETTTAAVSDTIESVKDAVKDTVNTVKGTVSESVETVKDAFDIPGYFREYPWAAFAVSVGAGFAGGVMLGKARDPVAQLKSRGRPFLAAAPPPSTNGAERDQEPPRPHVVPQSAPAGPGWADEVASKFGEELAKLKGVALGAAFGLVRHWVSQSARGDVGQLLGEVIDDVTRKLGGVPIRGNPMDSFTGNGGKASRDRDTGTEARTGERATTGR